MKNVRSVQIFTEDGDIYTIDFVRQEVVFPHPDMNVPLGDIFLLNTIIDLLKGKATG